jgi:bacillithiol synthase
MKKHSVDLDQTGQFSRFFLDYLAARGELRKFYSHEPKLESFKDAISAKKFDSAKRKVLVSVLKSQYEVLTISETALNQIEILALDNTFTVTTGHQLNLFTGPLYFIYKIVSTINLSKRLKATYPDSNFVPVYWMATEDHDFDEINYFKLDGKKYQWNTSQKGAVGEFELDASFRDFFKEVAFAPKVFKEAYQSSKKLSEAVRKYVHALFEEEGLLVLDGNDPRLKREFTEVIGSDLFDHTPYKKAKEASDALEKLGYKSQIFPREINFFYLDKGIRERIEKSGEEYQVLNSDLKFSKSEIQGLLETHPERFSPNVVLRPLFQEMILPNLAYLGGPAEVVYWLQLKGIFEYFSIPFPVLLPRNFALVLNATLQKKIEQLGWKQEDLFNDFESWKKTYVSSHSGFDFGMSSEKELVAAMFDKKGQEASILDKSLGLAFEAGKVRSLKILDQMGKKLRKAEERKHQIDLNRGKEVFDTINPGGSPQERVINMMQFYLGNPEFIQQLLDCFDPLEFKMMVLEVE